MKNATKGFGPVLLIFSLTTLAPHAWSQTQNIPQIQHVIVVIQENRTPDNLFGSDLHNSNGRQLPGADLVATGQCKTHNPTTIQIQAGPLASCWDPDHSHAVPGAWETSYDAGNMDDACDADYSWGPNCTPLQVAYTYVFQYTYADNSTSLLAPYFNIAQNYGYANYMFQTNQGLASPRTSSCSAEPRHQ